MYCKEKDYNILGNKILHKGKQIGDIDYQDRIMFGKDSYKKEEFYTYFRVLESDDEYFDYFRKRHAFWKMYGLNLPDDVLKKIYYKNALRLFPSIPKEPFE